MYISLFKLISEINKLITFEKPKDKKDTCDNERIKKIPVTMRALQDIGTCILDFIVELLTAILATSCSFTASIGFVL